MQASNSILLEQKRAELQVKLTILKENISHIKQQLDSMPDPEDLSSKVSKTTDIISIREYQCSALNDNLVKEKQTLEGLKAYLQNLRTQKEENDNEAEFYKRKATELKNKIQNLQNIYDESHKRKLLLVQEVQSLQNQNNLHTRKKFDNDKMHASSMNQQEFISNAIGKNAKKIQLMQTKIDQLNRQLNSNEGNLKEILNAIEEDETYNKSIQPNLIMLGENLKAYDDKLFLVRKEIDETNDYINSSNDERDKLTEQLEKMKDIMEKINNKNLKINANLQVILQSFEKKKSFMEQEKTFYDSCTLAKQKLVENLKEIDSYKDLI
ncbi:MAG: hypothetical protein MJ252_08955 [archaeon]|nr:hypothetical protein [archaeon]